MRWGVLAVAATTATAIDGGLLGPVSWPAAEGTMPRNHWAFTFEARGHRRSSDGVPAGAAPFSLFEDFPFSAIVGEAERASQQASDPPPIALDQDPQRFGSGRPTALWPEDSPFVRDLALPPEGIGEAVLETVLSDPLLRDLFGPGPLAQFLEHMLSALRGEGEIAHPSGEAQAASSAPPRRRDPSPSGGSLAGGAFLGGGAQPGALSGPAARPFVALPTDQFPDDRSAREGPAAVVSPPANAEARPMPQPQLPPGLDPASGGTGSAPAGSTPPDALESTQRPPAPPLSILPPEPGTGTVPISGPVVVTDPSSPARPNLAPDLPVAAVPEPAALASFAVGLLGLIGLLVARPSRPPRARA